MKSIKYHNITNCIIPLVCIGSLSTSFFIYDISFNFNNKTRRILNNSSIFLCYFGFGLSSYYCFNYFKYTCHYYNYLKYNLKYH